MFAGFLLKEHIDVGFSFFIEFEATSDGFQRFLNFTSVAFQKFI